MLSFTRSANAVTLAVILAVGGTTVLASRAEAASRRVTPHIVELFTAQGCSGCPDADQALKSLTERKDVIALTLPVDYWDYLGWKDTLAQPEFTARQTAYKTRFKLRELYTPQIVVDGRAEAPGMDRAKVDSLLKAPFEAVARVRLSKKQVYVLGHAPASGADVWVIRYDPQVQTVQVKSGDNKGKSVVQQNVVKSVARLGRWRGGDRSWPLPAQASDGLKTVVLVQTARGGDILGVGAY
jgi:hypothetical protein